MTRNVSRNRFDAEVGRRLKRARHVMMPDAALFTCAPRPDDDA